MNIGENIKKIRIKKNISRQELANKLCVSESTISRYENNKREPRIEVLKDIAIALNISFSELINPKNDLNNINNSINRLKKEYIDFLIDFEQLNDEGKNKVITYTKDLIEMPKYQKQIWEEEGKEHLIPITCHNDGLSDEEKENMDNIIDDFLKRKKEKTIDYNDFDNIAAHNDNLTDEEISEVDRRILEDVNKHKNK